MNGCILGTKPLYVALAQRKDERKAILTNQFMQQRLSNVWALGGPLLGSFQQPVSYFLPTVPQVRACLQPDSQEEQEESFKANIVPRLLLPETAGGFHPISKRADENPSLSVPLSNSFHVGERFVNGTLKRFFGQI